MLDYRYEYVFGHPDELAWMTHTFLVRDPRQAISSHYAMKPTVTCPEIGYEWLWELFQLLLVGHRQPAAGDPVRGPAARSGRGDQGLLRGRRAAVPARGSAAGRPATGPSGSGTAAGTWTRSRSSGFTSGRNAYPATVDNHPLLRSFYDYHYPFYQRIVQHASADTEE